MVRALSLVKGFITPKSRKPRTILGGILKGLKMNLDLSENMQTYVGLNELELAPAFRELSKDIHTAVDVGADMGYYTLFFLEKTPAKKVIVFEPADHSQKKLGENLALNGISADPRLVFHAKLVTGESSSNSMCLNDIADAVEGPTLVKLDIEGYEMDALKGAQKLLEKDDVRWIIETHSKELHIETRAYMEQFGYTVKEIGRPFWRMLFPELRPAEFNGWLTAQK